MSFRLARADFVKACQTAKVACPLVIVATGVISDNSAEELVTFVKQSHQAKIARVVFLNSPGGTVFGSLKLGLLLRAAKTATYVGEIVDVGGRSAAVRGGCFSACVMVLMGGTKRFFIPQSKVGVHRASLPGSAGDSVMAVIIGQRKIGNDGVSAMRRYASFMGVSPDLIDLGEKVSPNSIHVLSPAELTRYHLAQMAR